MKTKTGVLFGVAIIAVLAFLVAISFDKALSQASADSYLFVGEWQKNGCPAGYLTVTTSEHIGRNLIGTCVKDNDANPQNNDLVIAIGSLAAVCPSGYSQVYVSEHIGLNMARTCGKSTPAPAIAMGQYDSGSCPAQSGASLLATQSAEHIGLNFLRTCQYNVGAGGASGVGGGGGGGGGSGGASGAGGGGAGAGGAGAKLPQCSDGIDNDGDGKIDSQDPGCWKIPGDPSSYDPNDDSELNLPQCSDGVDNDGDKKIDGLDPGCWKISGDPASYDPNDDDERNLKIIEIIP